MSAHHHHHHHHDHDGDDHHHHHHDDIDGDDEDVQCNHEEGIGKIKSSALKDDPLFQKKNWTLQDYLDFNSKLPASKAKGKPSPKLIQYVKDLLPSEPARVLVPLCGKTPDLRWLYERGNTVVGIDGVEKLIKEFFAAHSDLSHTVEEQDFGKLYKTTDERLQIYVCDIKKIPAGTLGEFDAVFDWGAYSGIHKDDRTKYAEITRSLLKEDFRYFLEVCHDGPPKDDTMVGSVSLRSVKLDFGPSMHLRFLETKDVASGWGVDSYFNSYILMSPKGTS